MSYKVKYKIELVALVNSETRVMIIRDLFNHPPPLSPHAIFPARDMPEESEAGLGGKQRVDPMGNGSYGFPCGVCLPSPSQRAISPCVGDDWRVSCVTELLVHIVWPIGPPCRLSVIIFLVGL